MKHFFLVLAFGLLNGAIASGANSCADLFLRPSLEQNIKNVIDTFKVQNHDTYLFQKRTVLRTKTIILIEAENLNKFKKLEFVEMLKSLENDSLKFVENPYKQDYIKTANDMNRALLISTFGLLVATFVMPLELEAQTFHTIDISILFMLSQWAFSDSLFKNVSESNLWKSGLVRTFFFNQIKWNDFDDKVMNSTIFNNIENAFNQNPDLDVSVVIVDKTYLSAMRKSIEKNGYDPIINP
jgi:hypothetical protein